MPFWKVDTENAKDPEQRVKQLTTKAKLALSKYSHHYSDELISAAVHCLLTKNDIAPEAQVSESKWNEIINNKALLEVILTEHFARLKHQISTQRNWLYHNDVHAKLNEMRARDAFLEQLQTICEKKYQGNTIEQSIQFRLKQGDELNNIIMKTDKEIFKDRNTLNILEVISSILKLLCMTVLPRLYFNRIISLKCNMGNSLVTLWSGKSLNTVHMEHLKAKSDQLAETCKIVAEALEIQPAIHTP